MQSSTSSSRRGFLTQAAGVVAGSTALGIPLRATAEPLQGPPDPILAAIEKHRAIYAAHEDAVRRNFALEEELPEDRRQSRYGYGSGKEIVETDDPRWIASQKEVDELSTAEIDAAAEIVDIKPTTLAGALALLKYTMQHEERNDEWSAMFNDDQGNSRSWYYFLCQNLVKLLSEAA